MQNDSDGPARCPTGIHEESGRRVKMIYLPVRQLLGMLDWKSRDYDTINLPVIEGLPDGYVVRAVEYQFERDAFALMIEHSSFDLVPFGVEAPAFMEPLMIASEAVRVAREPAVIGTD